VNIEDIGIMTIENGGTTEWVSSSLRLPTEFEMGQFNNMFYVLYTGSDSPSMITLSYRERELPSNVEYWLRNVEYWLRVKVPPRPDKTMHKIVEERRTVIQEELGQELEDFLGMNE